MALQVNPLGLDFKAVVGQDAPVTLTLFNPHPVERIAFKIKTTASSTYRVWPNSGALEPGETARVQVLLLGTKVDLGDPRRLDECSHDRFQVQYMPLAEKQSFDNGLFKLYAGLVRDIKMGVTVALIDQLSPKAALDDSSPWEGMVRVALLRMMADEEREASHNAACLTKFSELLVLNGIITTEQMWGAFQLVGDMYQSLGEGQKVMSKVEQWLEHPDFFNVGDPDAASLRRGSDAGHSSRGGSEPSSPPGPLRTPHPREEVPPVSRREGEESYPNSPLTQRSGDGSVSGGGGATPADSRRVSEPFAFTPAAKDEAAAEAADVATGRFEDAKEGAAPARVAATSAHGFGSASSSVSQGASVSDAENASAAASRKQVPTANARLKEVAELAGSVVSGGTAKSADDDDDSLAREMAAAREMAVAGASNKRVSASFAAAREVALAAAAANEQAEKQQQSRVSSRQVTPVKVSVQERKAALAAASVQPTSPSNGSDLDEAFAPGMLAEARAQMAAAGTAMAATAVTVPTGPHMLSFADRAAMYGALNGSRSSRDHQEGGSRQNGAQEAGSSRQNGVPSEQSSSRQPKQIGRPNGRTAAQGTPFRRVNSQEAERDRRRQLDEYARPSATDTAAQGSSRGGDASNPAGNLGRPSGAETASSSQLARPSGAGDSAAYATTADSPFGRNSGGLPRRPSALGVDGRPIPSGRRSVEELAQRAAAEESAQRSAAVAADLFRRSSSSEMRSSLDPPGPLPRLARRSASELRRSLDPPSQLPPLRAIDLARRSSAEMRLTSAAQMPRDEPLTPKSVTAGAADSPGWYTSNTSGAATPTTDPESLGPAVRVLLPGKQSLTRGEVAAATANLRVGAFPKTSSDGQRNLRTTSGNRADSPAAVRRTASQTKNDQAADREAIIADTTATTPVVAAARRQGVAEAFSQFRSQSGGAAAPLPGAEGGDPREAAAGSGDGSGGGTPAPPQRKQKSMFKKLTASLTARAEAAARSAASQGGYYYV